MIFQFEFCAVRSSPKYHPFYYYSECMTGVQSENGRYWVLITASASWYWKVRSIKACKE